jgi:hypothetical protein
MAVPVPAVDRRLVGGVQIFVTVLVIPYLGFLETIGWHDIFIFLGLFFKKHQPVKIVGFQCDSIWSMG